MALPLNFLNDLLERYVLLLSTIVDIPARPRIIAEPQPPEVQVFVSRLTPSRSLFGSDYVAFDVQVTLRLITGGVGSGSIGEKEGDVNRIGLEIVSMLALYYQLEHPVTKEAFDYLHPDIAERIVSFNGPTQFNYGNTTAPKLFVGATLIDEVRLLTKRR